ncbi:unnamed protein product [Symbiodinium necroappetens]|uniref:Uncharacterized protein n=1 Tax=Symbiodinium necroappetens TaxID=1628268 RepID=A0A813CFI5_9DINO|nr:unnamed protein product [Symbiodinium necroappetens]
MQTFGSSHKAGRSGEARGLGPKPSDVAAAGAGIFALPEVAKADSEVLSAFLGTSDGSAGEGSYIKWGFEQQAFAVVFFVLFPFGTLYLIFSGRLGWWNYDESGKEYTAEEYRKMNNVEKPTWGRFPWELESDLYKK